MEAGSLNIILNAVAVLFVLGAAFGLGLAVASRKLAVESDPRIDEIEELIARRELWGLWLSGVPRTGGGDCRWGGTGDRMSSHEGPYPHCCGDGGGNHRGRTEDREGQMCRRAEGSGATFHLYWGGRLCGRPEPRRGS